MSYNIDIKYINHQSFTDSKIITMSLNEKSKSVYIILEGGWIIKDNRTIFFSEIRISISDWHRLDIFLEEEDATSYLKRHPDVNVILDSICEVELKGKAIIFRGYGKGKFGVWTEWRFLDPAINVTGNECQS